eukprot:447481-Pelagomonas_calceolata.AAC.4
MDHALHMEGSTSTAMASIRMAKASVPSCASARAGPVFRAALLHMSLAAKNAKATPMQDAPIQAKPISCLTQVVQGGRPGHVACTVDQHVCGMASYHGPLGSMGPEYVSAQCVLPFFSHMHMLGA